MALFIFANSSKNSIKKYKLFSHGEFNNENLITKKQIDTKKKKKF